jgi:hypothetical protein
MPQNPAETSGTEMPANIGTSSEQKAETIDRRISVAPMMDWTDAVNFPRGIIETPCLLYVAPVFNLPDILP